MIFCRQDKLLLFFLYLRQKRRLILKNDFKTNTQSTKIRRLHSKTTINNHTQTHTHTHTHTLNVSRFSFEWKRENNTHTKSIWDEEFELFVSQKLATSLSTSTRFLRNDHRKRSFFRHQELRIEDFFHNDIIIKKLVIVHDRIRRSRWRDL